MRHRALLLGLWLSLSGCSDLLQPGFGDWEPPSAPAARTNGAPRAACRESTPDKRAFFGDLHVHTALSFDTVMRGGVASPDDAYRFARGEEIGLAPIDANGQPTRRLRLERALDFAAVTDHAEWLGEVSLCTRPGSPAFDSSACRVFRGEESSWLGSGMVARMASIVGFFGRANVCGENAARCRAELASAWEHTRAAAERWYDRSPDCSFTTFQAWEYSASPKRSKVHRNVILRNEIAPELPISWLDQPDVEGLWSALRTRCNDTDTGCEALAIPHNPNLSNGQMFAPLRMDLPVEDRRRLARLRADMEPLVEITQAKGDSECRGGFASVAGDEDELCDFEKVRWIDGEPPEDCGEGTGGGALSGKGCQSRRDFVRYTLIEGLRERDRLGENPFKLGLIGGTDTHNGTPGATEEATYAGHNGATDATLELRFRGDAGGNYVASPRRNPGGLVGIWATENTRDALFDAMKRRETFATSGTRIVPRLFAAWDLPADACGRADRDALAAESGVTMGGTLPTGHASRAPRFLATALRDPGTDRSPGHPLERIQIVKGWVGPDGRLHQSIHDVAGTALGAPDRDTCAPSPGGSDALCSVWTDPDFDPTRSAVYYARILEVETCRWTRLQCLAAPAGERPAECEDPDVPWKLRERAWTSPIWYEAPRPAGTT